MTRNGTRAQPFSQADAAVIEILADWVLQAPPGQTMDQQIESIVPAITDAVLAQSELAGWVELVEYVGRAKSTLQRWENGVHGFPKPFHRLAYGPVWLMTDVRSWAIGHQELIGPAGSFWHEYWGSMKDE